MKNRVIHPIHGLYAQQGQRISVAAMACAIRQRNVLIESSTCRCALWGTARDVIFG